MNADSKLSKWRLVVRGLLGVAIFVAVLFIPAGRLNWLEGWVFLVALFSYLVALQVWGYRKDPELVRERSRMGPNVEGWDKVIVTIYLVLLFVMLVTAGLDAGRYQWSSAPRGIQILGWMGFFAAAILIWRVMSVNTFSSSMVRIQADRGHQVITTGPYRYVRHPMYVGVIVLLLSIPLVLGSWWATLPAVLIGILFVVRTVLEERTLKEGLHGYPAYMDRVRYRLLPGVW
jgi:protein-S-isoprenylcysteine O-methyltransferase Ste14